MLNDSHLDARGEFHHLFCLNILQAIDTGNTVTDRQHSASLLNIDWGSRSQDAFLKDWRHFRCS